MIKKCLIFFIAILGFCLKTEAQDTFSICAIDPETGEVGSAGASCIDGSIIISDVHPGVGVVHTQASYMSPNQEYARYLMNKRVSPIDMIDSLKRHDYLLNPNSRQYGIVDLTDGGRSAGYTGKSCLDYKNHILGKTYSIQGNILLGQSVLDSIEARFVRTSGSLACKLMAALQGANVPGADTRCLTNGTSSKSAFLRVARPTDPVNQLSIDLNVNSVPEKTEPIDSLQRLFNRTLACQTTGLQNNLIQSTFKIRLYGDATSGNQWISMTDLPNQPIHLELFNAMGQLVFSENFFGNSNLTIDISTLPLGVIFYRTYTQQYQLIQTGKLLAW